jgi:hypothetical protein
MNLDKKALIVVVALIAMLAISLQVRAQTANLGTPGDNGSVFTTVVNDQNVGTDSAAVSDQVTLTRLNPPSSDAPQLDSLIRQRAIDDLGLAPKNYHYCVLGGDCDRRVPCCPPLYCFYFGVGHGSCY